VISSYFTLQIITLLIIIVISHNYQQLCVEKKEL